jgi:carbonic anhydrase
MKRSIWLGALGMAMFVSVSASDAATDTATISEAEKDKIRAIVKEVMREYAASLNDKKIPDGAKEIMREIARSNREFMRARGPAHFKPFLHAQHPRATVVTCSDSRLHTHALDATPDGDLFMIRNIGNQITTAEGSVEYGVHHLHTPLLLIVGHVACGAIKAASGDYAKESPGIQRELDTLQIAKGDPGLNSVKQNVNNQVRLAMGKFEGEVMSGRLTVVGAVYDFLNEMKLGQGKLNIININGETDPAKIAKLDLMQGLDAPAPKAAPRATPRKAPAKEASPKESADQEADAKESAKQDSK